MLKSDTFKRLADKLITNDFGDFQRVLIMKKSNPITVGSDPTFTEEIGTGIALKLSDNQFQKQSIALGDFKIITNVSQWTIDPNVDNIEMEFDGTPILVKSVLEDPAKATYMIIAKKK